MKLVVTIELDDRAADDHNASLYDPAHDDPVVGDGKSLVFDVVSECGIDEITRGWPGGSWGAIIKNVTATLDGEPIEYPRA
jgi:hypothetical protein